jgi:trimethylguanosine synthase
MGKRQRGKNQQPAKRRRRFVPKRLWVEDCLELLPPPLPPPPSEIAAAGHELTTSSLNNVNTQLWVKITAKVLATEDQDEETTAPSKTDAQLADSVDYLSSLRLGEVVPATTVDTEPEFLGPSGAWLIEPSKDHKESRPGLETALAESPNNSGVVSEALTSTAVVATTTCSAAVLFPEKNIFIQRLAADVPKVPSLPLKHLPQGDCGDGIQNPHPEVANKYWAQRRRLFSKFDEGIQMVDAESWYSVTPELIARHIASRLCDKASSASSDPTVTGTNKKIILDAFGGIGGNAIAFALHAQVDLVVCVDTDKAKLEAAANNCRVYTIPNQRVVFIHGNVCDLFPHYKDGSLCRPKIDSDVVTEEIHGYRIGGFDLLPSRLDSIFLSPPWGGVDYMEHGNRHFNLDCIKVSHAVSGKDLLRLALNALSVPDIAMFLPRNLNGLMVAEDCFELGLRGTIEVERNYVQHKLKTITVYILAPLD